MGLNTQATVKAQGEMPGVAAPSGMTALRRVAMSRLTYAEDRLLMGLVVVSAIVHLIVLLTDGFKLTRDARDLSDEWSIDADLIQDFDLGAPNVSALPKAEVKAPEAKVPENMLPQITKKVTIEESTKPEEVIAEEKVIEPEKVKEEAKPAEKVKEEPDIKLKSEDESNKLKKEEALRRLAMERLRNEEKTAKTTEAPEEDPLAKIASEASKRKKLNSGAVASTTLSARHKKYGAMLDAAVRQNYSLPEVYNLKGANMKVLLTIAVTDRGELAELAVKQSSGDTVFDELTMQAVRASVPLPKPPLDLVGMPITLVFSP